jgi:hypothetical protein
VKSRLAWLWAHHRVLLIAFMLAVAAALFFSVRATLFLVYWSDPDHRDQPIEGWMTPRYVATSYDLPIEVVTDMLDIVPEAERRPTLEMLARRKGVPVDDLISELDARIAAWKAAHP